MTAEDRKVLPGVGENPAASAGMLWLQLLENDRFDLAWATLTDEFRLWAIQDWMVQNPSLENEPTRAAMDRDELAQALALPAPTHQLWTIAAARVAERGIRGVTTGVLAGRPWSAGARQRLLSADLELVRIFPHDQLTRDESGALVFADGAVAEVVSLLMTPMPGGWLVAGLGGWVPRPGWPPQIQMLAEPSD